MVTVVATSYKRFFDSILVELKSGFHYPVETTTVDALTLPSSSLGYHLILTCPKLNLLTAYLESHYKGNPVTLDIRDDYVIVHFNPYQNGVASLNVVYNDKQSIFERSKPSYQSLSSSISLMESIKSTLALLYRSTTGHTPEIPIQASHFTHINEKGELFYHTLCTVQSHPLKVNKVIANKLIEIYLMNKGKVILSDTMVGIYLAPGHSEYSALTK